MAKVSGFTGRRKTLNKGKIEFVNCFYKQEIMDDIKGFGTFTLERDISGFKRMNVNVKVGSGLERPLKLMLL